MQKRNTSARRKAIVEWVNNHKQVQVETLVDAFSTSAVTIRKDLAKLEEDGLLLRNYGGASALHQSDTAPQNMTTHRQYQIGQLAASLVQDNHRILVDTGSTTSCLLANIHDRRGLVVMTNSLDSAREISGWESEPTLLVTGGTWDPQSNSLQGQMAESLLNAYSFDMAFVGASGLDVNRGTTTFNELTQLSQTMAKVADIVVVMAESRKLGHKMPNLELSWKDIGILVTDAGIDSTSKQQIEEQGVTVLIADDQED